MRRKVNHHDARARKIDSLRLKIYEVEMVLESLTNDFPEGDVAEELAIMTRTKKTLDLQLQQLIATPKHTTQ